MIAGRGKNKNHTIFVSEITRLSLKRKNIILGDEV
jgi:hypothetical protein